MLHLLIVIPDLQAGTGTFTKNLAAGLRGLNRDEFRVSMLMMRPRELTAEESSCFDEVHTIGTPVSTNWKRVYEGPLTLLRLRRKLRELKPDLVFTVGTFSNLAVSMASDRPPVMSEHMNMTERLRSAPYAGLMRKLMKWRYPGSLIVVASEGIAQDLRQGFNAGRVEVIPNGLDAERVRRLSMELAPPLPTGERFLISIGRLTEQKDYPTLLRAFAHARKAGMREHLVILGDGDLRVQLQTLARQLGTTDSVHFMGQVSNPYPILRQARAFVLSSIFEGFAYTPLEAMALDVPVIATDCPSGPADILGNGQYGLLVPPSDVEGLAGAMLEVTSSDAGHQHLASQARIRSAQLSIENMVRQYRELFLAQAKR